jgi:hypothetical protein
MLKRLGIVIEPASIRHQFIERLFAGMAERRMAEIMNQCHALGQILVQLESPGQRPGDLRHFDGVGQPGAVVVALMGNEDLGLVLEPPERRGVDDAVPVTLEFGPGRTDRFSDQPAPARPRIYRPRRTSTGPEAQLLDIDFHAYPVNRRQTHARLAPSKH